VAGLLLLLLLLLLLVAACHPVGDSTSSSSSSRHGKTVTQLRWAQLKAAAAKCASVPNYVNAGSRFNANLASVPPLQCTVN
jgi:hypothetical protein